MTETTLPRLLSSSALAVQFQRPDLFVADLCRAEIYQQGHLPEAVHVDYNTLVTTRPPTLGLVPEMAALERTLSQLGLQRSDHVVAYDDEGGGRACRLLWTLALLGHEKLSLLDGGTPAWRAQGLSLETTPTRRLPSRYSGRRDDSVVADREYILARLGDPALVLLDARSPGEYTGADVRAQRGGHIPGAVNFEWTRAMDMQQHRKLHDPAQLRAELASLGVTPDKEVVTYCQSHHRSAHTWFTLNVLGFDKVRGYPGSWSDWGNAPDTPVETD